MHDTSDLILDDLGADTANTFPVDYLDNRRRSFSDTAALTGRCLGNDMDAMLVDVLRGPSPDGLDDTERTQF